MAWHGTYDKHPKIIYEGKSESNNIFKVNILNIFFLL